MKTVLITGCNRGLGKGIMERFASEGYNIIALIRKENEEFSKLINALIEKYGITITPVYAQLDCIDSLMTAINSIVAMEQPIDVLINNAAINICKPAFYMGYEEVEKSFKINYFAPFLLCREVGALMMRQGSGSIVNISSVAGLVTEAGGAAYDASKAALNTFTKSFAQEVAPLGVRVNAVACSVVLTDMFNALKPEVQKKTLKKVAMRRPSEIDEIANTILFLTSEKASYITGQIIRVDGGYTI